MAMAWQSQDENAPQAEPDQAVNAATVPESMQQNTGATVPVRGTVRSALTDSPLPRVLVSIQGDITTGALTDGEGRFELPAVPVGPIPFSVRKPGYSTLSAQQDEEIATQNVVVAANMPEIVLRLTPTAAIQGRITLSTGDPAAGVSVHLQRRLILNGRAQWQPPLIQKTDGAGHYRFSNLSEGRYILFT